MSSKSTALPEPSRAPPTTTSANVRTASTCTRLPLFSVYRQAGAIKEQSAERVRLELRIDLHAADCGAPDGYGHDMAVTFELEAVEGRCVIKTVSSRSTPFGELEPGKTSAPWLDTFQPTKTVNLADTALEELELRDPKTRHALVLLPWEYYFYENVGREAVLKHELEGEDSKGCCYGATGARLGQWYAEFYRSPFATFSTGKAEGDELKNFNRWATENELRSDLPRLVRRGFELSDTAKIETVFTRGDPARAATLTVRDRWDESWDDPERRAHARHRRTLELSLSRKECTDCEGGMTPWWLWSVKATTHCRGADGGFVESEQPCPPSG